MVSLSELETPPGLSIGLAILAVKPFVHIKQHILPSFTKSGA